MSKHYWQGEQVRLRAVEPADWEAHFQWDQDTEMERALARVYFPHSRERTKRWAERMAEQGGDGDGFHFEIENLEGELVGSITTNRCDSRNGTFTYGVAIREGERRKGYAEEAIRMVLRYYFEELRYQKVTIYVYSFNEASIRLHERLGFQREGCLRRMMYTQGKFYDEVYFGMTAEEFGRDQAGI